MEDILGTDGYRIIDEYLTSDIEGHHKFQVKVTDHFREREMFAWLPIYKNKKFRWLKKIKVKEQLYLVRKSDFDSGWSYTEYWGPEKKNWKIVEIL